MSIKLLVLSTALMLLLTACGGSTAEPLPTYTPYPTYTPVPTPAPAAIPTPVPPTATSTPMPVGTPLPAQPFVVENEATTVALRETPTPTVVPAAPATATPTGLPTATLTAVPPAPTAAPMPATADTTQSNSCDAAPANFKKLCEEAMANNPDSEASGSSSIGYDAQYAQSYDPENIPQIANFNFTELDKYSKMSKLRSGVGHDYSFNTSEYDPTRKNCRSMKHYFIPMGVPLENALYSITPHAFEWMSIKFFAPADGTLTNVIYSQNEYGTEATFSILSSQYPGYYFTYYHIALDPNLTEGMLVEAGEQIGTLGHEESWGEIAVEVRINSRETHLISFLQVATDDVLEMYKLRGMNTASDVIITKELRDATPLACEDSEARFFEGSGREGASLDEQFMIWAFESSDNWFFFD